MEISWLIYTEFIDLCPVGFGGNLLIFYYLFDYYQVGARCMPKELVP